ncbi:MAG: LytTR family DNA-binding domain-containing protein [Peptococcaceae bacterium]|nr:LytTR family DNA-binding domain-containing protein [Peptococcaceae bacterium]
MHFAICDDNLYDSNLLENYFLKRNIETEIYTSGEELMRDYKENARRYDALFLDMEMDGMNGIETANMIREIDERVPIVFVTAYTVHMRESFKCSPLRFLLKPIIQEELKEAVDTICSKYFKKRSTFSFNDNKDFHRIYCEDILYCESHNNWINIHTLDHTYQVRMTLTELEKTLEPGMFSRAHKSYLVNLEYIETISGNEISLYHCDVQVPLGRTYKDHFKADVARYEIERGW